ncbi:MAG TPA: xylulokinase [Anaerolineales bacterium]|nr:xylulokinase [Anaerolineales bacterium]
MTYFLGVDVGSSGCKVTAIDGEGAIVSSASQAYQTSYPKPGWAEQNPQDWFDSACAAIRCCLREGRIDPKDVLAISLDGPAHNVALLDENDKVLYPTLHWSDTRSIRQCEFLKAQYLEKIFKISYHQPNPSWTLSQLLWLKENEPEVWKKLRKIQVTKDYVRLRFTGDYATDVYDAIGTQLFDVEKSAWSEEICELLEFPTEYLPKVRRAMDVAGKLNGPAAQATGLPAGIPVAIGSGDSVVEAYGVGALVPGQCVVKIATSATVSLVTAAAHPTLQTITYPHVSGKSWYSIAATNCGAATMRWFKDTIGHGIEKQAESEGKNVFSLIDELARSIPAGCEGLIFHPYLNGERTPYWDPLLRGDFVGITSHHSLAHFARAIMEGVAFSLYDCFLVIQEMAPTVSDICMIGGGTKSPVWSQILCDTFGLPLSKPAMDDAAYGSAILAGVAAGYLDGSLGSIRRLVKVEKTFRPDAEIHDVYRQYFEIYRSVTQHLAEANHKIALLTRSDA